MTYMTINHGEARQVIEIPADIEDRQHGRLLSGAADTEVISTTTPKDLTPEAAVWTTPDGTTRSRKSARPRENSAAEVIVHYAVPEGQRYLPITLNHTVTMIYLGRHHEDHVYEPINTWLRSGEDGLRYHRSMNVDDVYGGPLGMATFGRPVAGPLSEDQQWLVTPPSYDPTRPPPTPIMDEDHHVETHLAADQY